MKKLFSENKIFEFLELCSFTCPIMSNGKLIFATTQPQLKVACQKTKPKIHAKIFHPVVSSEISSVVL